MTSMPGETNETELPLLERFGRALAHIVHEERPDVLDRSITVAELYQDIAPYRRMRDLAGIEMHADYEHALIRLLAGEHGYARLEPDTARDELAIEADAMEPNLSAYRKFAACDVRLAPHALVPGPAVAPRPIPPPAAPLVRPSEPTPAVPPQATPSAEPEASASEPEAPATAPSPPPTPVAGGRAPDAGAHRCDFCGKGLPSDRDVRYCPFCGGDQMSPRCGACGEDLEEDWRYCVACGASAQR